MNRRDQIEHIRRQQSGAEKTAKRAGIAFGVFWVLCFIVSLVMTGLIIWGLVEGILWLRSQ